MDKKVALVTGAGTGLGRAIAITLGKLDYQLILIGRRLSKLEETASEIESDGVFVLPCDVTDEESISSLHTQFLAQSASGKLDVLVNNVGGVVALGSVAELNLANWNQTITLNLTSQFLVTKAFLPQLRESGNGKIIAVSSMAAHTPLKSFSAYSAAKAGVEALMKVVAEEEKENGIEVHLLDPGNVISEGNPQGMQHPMEIMYKVIEILQQPF